MIRVAQLLLLLSAGGLWVASRLTWVTVRSADGLGPDKTINLDGAAWSNGLVPMAVLLLAAALAALAVRGWALRAMALLLAVVCFTLGYLGTSLIVMPDVGPRGAEVAGLAVSTLVGSQRHLPGAALTLVVAVTALVAAILLMRSAVSSADQAARYAAPGAAGAAAGMSERGMWDALDEGRDPTGSDTEGR